MAKVTDGFSGFVRSLGTEIIKLVQKQCKDIQTTVKADHAAIYAFLGSVNSKLSQPGCSS